MSTMSSQEFNRNPTSAKRQADEGPVYVTEHGKPAYVVINIDEYRRLKGELKADLVTRLQMDEYHDVELPPVEMDIKGATF
ncbi:type II toxin-antitoxin system Phd/YefM family antitoxin [Microlunatus speluncae]|uniref:type II toxin-antitoxin system Phd/YefM family antitoxin n=1 Tax=Microlunatus speluncae TaxID=2594267 RepID=UPI0012667A1B|nr:type II toxin-antitoxin system Phd/YefM family antitoxin [Microlunatus speluncae]